jgi:hypothetical protein
VACVAALVSDVTILGALAVHLLLLNGWISPVPCVLAVTASLLRMAVTGRVLLRASTRLQ